MENQAKMKSIDSDHEEEVKVGVTFQGHEEGEVLEHLDHAKVKEKLKEPFNYPRFLALLDDVDLQHYKVHVFVDLLFQITKMFQSMGKTMSRAFSDVTSKALLISTNHEKHFPECDTIKKICAKEVEKGIHRLNGKNMKKEHFKDHSSPFYKYTSVSRTIVRNSWLIHFLTVMLDHLEKFPEKKVSKCAKEAYSVALGPHHPAIVRAGASLALLSCPKRTKFLPRILGKDVQDGEVNERLREILKRLEPLNESLQKYLVEQDFTKLP